MRGLGNPEETRERWSFAVYRRTGCSNLFVDGWLSEGNDNHLAPIHLAQVRTVDRHWQPSVNGFSYYAPKFQYIGDDTNGPLEKHISNFTAVLSGAAPNAKYVITAYSMGAAVTLIALGRFLSHVSSLRKLVPFVILLEPAIYGAPDLLTFLQGEDTPFLEVPPIALDLGREDFNDPVEARESVALLLDAGIAVAILYSSHDSFAPYRPFPDQRVFHNETPADALVRRGQIDPVAVHFQMRTTASNHLLIYHLTKPLVDLKKV